MYGALASGTGRIKRIPPQEAEDSNKIEGKAAGAFHTHALTHDCERTNTTTRTHRVNTKQHGQQLKQAGFTALSGRYTDLNNTLTNIYTVHRRESSWEAERHFVFCSQLPNY